MESKGCCGLDRAEECRCHTEAAALAEALRAYVGRRVRRLQDAEDITQDAMLRLYRSAGSLREEQALEGWMYRIAGSAIVDHYRRSAVRPDPVSPDDLAQLVGADDEGETRADAELAACLHPLLARLPNDYRTALELTDLGGLTQEQAAEQLGLSTSGMKSRVQRGRRMLRTEVGRCCRVELDGRGAIADASLRDETC
jgi:RNA polymerase sigma-70 factor (ECF subfamily)